MTLLPCPFCGGCAEIFVARAESYGYYDETRAAGCMKKPRRCASSPAFSTQEFIPGQGMVHLTNTDELATAAWNTRSDKSAELESKLRKAVQIAEKYATVYSEDKPAGWEDRADCMLWGIHRDLLHLKEAK
jgi:hypothetical protein